jgi:hypothetical protein
MEAMRDSLPLHTPLGKYTTLSGMGTRDDTQANLRAMASAVLDLTRTESGVILPS